MKQLNELLQEIEDKTDLEHIKFTESLYLDAINYRQVPYLPLSIILPPVFSKQLYPYSQAFNEPSKMLHNELLSSFGSIYNNLYVKSHYIPQIRANYGIGIISSLFGAKCKVVNDNLPWVEHLSDIDAVKKVIDKGIPDFNFGLGSRVVDFYLYTKDILSNYPICRQLIRLTQPDLQGPFDIAHLLMGNLIFTDVYDNPKIVHSLLELITQTYIHYRMHISNVLNSNIDKDSVCVHGALFGGQVLIKGDTAAINLSQQMYEEFEGQYVRKIFNAFQGGSMHYCGNGRSWHQESIYCPQLKGINYGNPEMHNLSNLYSYWSPKKIPIIWWGYNQPKEFLDQVYKSGIKTGMTLAVQVNDIIEAKQLLENHIKKGNSR